MTHKKRALFWFSISLCAAIALIAYGRFLYPGPFSVNDWTYPIPAKIIIHQNWPTIFANHNLNNYLGLALHGNTFTSIATWSFNTLHIAPLVFTWVVYTLLPILLLFSGMWILGKRLEWSPITSLIASVLFAINSYVIILLSAGHINGILAYATFPLVLYAYDLFLKKPRLSYLVALDLLSLIISSVEPRYFLLLAIVLFWWTVARWRQYPITKKHFKPIIIGFSLFILLNAYWIYGTFVVSGTAVAPQGYTDAGWLDALSYATVWHALLLHHVWWPPFHGIAEPNWIFITIPVLSIFALLNKRRSFALGIFGLLLTGIFLTKGINPPFGEAYRWIFLHVPGFSGFRDPAKFFSLIAMAYSILVPLGLMTIWESTQIRLHKITSVLLGILLLFSIGSGYWPLWSQYVQGTFHKETLVPTAVSNWFQENAKDGQWYRILWYPKAYRYYTYDPNTPSIETLEDPMRIVRSHLPNTDEWLNTLQKPGYTDYLLNSYGIKYVVIPGDTAHELYNVVFPFSQNKAVTAWADMLQLNRAADVTDELGTTTYILENQSYSDRAFLSKNLVITDSVDHPAFSTLVDHNPTVTALAWKDDIDLAKGSASLYRYARSILIDAPINEEEQEVGHEQWDFTLPLEGDYRITLPKTPYPYLLDNQSIQQDQEVHLNEGAHTIAIDLEKVTATSILSTPSQSTDWHACSDGEAGFLPAFDSLRNEQILHTQDWSQLSNATQQTLCIATTSTPDALANSLITTWQGKETGTPYVGINLHPIFGKETPLHEPSTISLITIPNGVEEIRVKIVLPAASSLSTESFTMKSISLPSGTTVSPIQLTPIMSSQDNEPLPEMHFTQESESSGSVLIRPHTHGVWLTINTEYHPGWQLSASNNVILDTHFPNALQQNSWYIPPSETTGSYTLLFVPARRIYTAHYISVATFLIMSLYLLTTVGIRQKL